MDLSFKKDDQNVEDAEQKLYFCDAIVDFSDETELKGGKETIVLFGQPVENRDVYIMERRIGCDVGAFVLRKYLGSIPYAYNHALEELNIISFLGYYITDPVKVISEEKTDFYTKEVFGELTRTLESKKMPANNCRFIDVSGSFDVLLHTILSAVGLFGSDTILVKFSPFGYESYLSKTKLTTHHFGIDRKIGMFEEENEHNKYHFYDIESGSQSHIQALTSIFETSKKVIIVWDCMVFSSEYFYGSPVPFPFSYSLKEIIELQALINKNSKKVGMIGFCHFNPAVEEKKSAFFLVDLIYKFINSFEEKSVLKCLNLPCE